VPLSDADLMTWWSSAPHANVEETRDYITPRVEEGRWRSWAITLRGDDEALGWVSVGNRREAVSEIGYLLARAQWGGGIAREAVSAVINQLFHAEGHRRLFADTDPDNDGSNALLRRLGFILEGRLRGEWETHIGVRDSYIWGLLKDEWRAQ
jgi:RimJ/RimL family protein N-acetyltransferase